MELPRESAGQIIRFLQMDFTELIIQTAVVEHTDAYWNAVMRKQYAISEKYKGDDLVTRILEAYIDYLDNLDRQIYPEGGGWIHGRRK